MPGLGRRHRARRAELVDFDHIGHHPALRRLPGERRRQTCGEAQRAERHPPPVARLHPGGADALVPQLAGPLERRLGFGGLPIALDAALEDHRLVLLFVDVGGGGRAAAIALAKRVKRDLAVMAAVLAALQRLRPGRHGLGRARRGCRCAISTLVEG